MEDTINYIVKMKREKCFFSNLLTDHNITKEMFTAAKFTYCGAYTAIYDNENSSDCIKVKSRHYEPYFEMYWKDKQEEMKKEIEIKSECLCNQPIQNNYFIHSQKLNKVLSLGKCCIKKFNPSGLKKLCESCGCVHKNRIDNFCSDCRKNCNKCRKDRPYKNYDICLECYKKMDKPCFECGVEKKNSYKYCYKCNLAIKNK